MKMKQYHQAQNDRWYEHYLNSEKLLSEAEDIIRTIEAKALEYISDETRRAEITKIVDDFWRGARS